jgi:hypothetical protein
MGMGVKFRNDYDSSHEIQPIYQKVYDLIHKEWKTKLTLKSDSDGTISFRGFCGNYSLGLKPEGGPPIGYSFDVRKEQPLNSIILKTVL